MAKPKRWTEMQAVVFLQGRGAEVIDKTIKIDGCLGGLTGGAALDYLINHKGYRVARAVESKSFLQRLKRLIGR